MRRQDFLQKQETLLCVLSTIILGFKVFKETLLKDGHHSYETYQI